MNCAIVALLGVCVRPLILCVGIEVGSCHVYVCMYVVACGHLQMRCVASDFWVGNTVLSVCRKLLTPTCSCTH